MLKYCNKIDCNFLPHVHLLTPIINHDNFRTRRIREGEAMPLIKLLDGIYVMINDIEQRKVMHLKIIKARQIYLKYTNNISFIIWRNEDGNRSGNGDNNGGSSVEGGH